MQQNQQTQDLLEQVAKLRSDFDNLSQSFYKNNFSSSQTFTKDIICQTRLKVPHYTIAPAICEIGDLIEIGGQLFICTVPNTTFELVGAQS